MTAKKNNDLNVIKKPCELNPETMARIATVETTLEEVVRQVTECSSLHGCCSRSIRALVNATAEQGQRIQKLYEQDIVASEDHKRLNSHFNRFAIWILSLIFLTCVVEWRFASRIDALEKAQIKAAEVAPVAPAAKENK